MNSIFTVIPPIWQRCLTCLEAELSDQHLNTWVRPLQARTMDNTLCLLAPNRFVLDWVNEHYLSQIQKLIQQFNDETIKHVEIVIGEHRLTEQVPSQNSGKAKVPTSKNLQINTEKIRQPPPVQNNLDPNYYFSSFVEGKSNAMAKAAAMQVSENPGNVNPLLIYGGVGLGKTHLMHAVGHAIIEKNPKSRVVYLHAERFVGDMVKALQHNVIDDFKRLYRSVDALLIDDIQFFARKERSQEEFFHTFNVLMEQKKQVILTCDRYPKEIDGLEDRLKSRFGWGLSYAIEPPELEERVAILQNKAELAGVNIPSEVAFFIAQRIRSNVRELEGAMRRVIANSHFTGKPITLDFTQEALRDLIALQDKLITIDNIQKTVADYYQIRVSDILSTRRSRSITRPRQLAMSLAKELTNHSLPEIGDAFGGRDHTTVLHACRKVKELRDEDIRIAEDFQNLMRTLSRF